MTATPVRLALIGLGGMGSAHLEILTGLPQAQITAIADPYAPFADRAASQAPGATVFYDPLDCVNTADIDAAVIATADHTHFEITQACIARNLPVLCEKPLATTSHQSLQIVEAERATGRRLVQVGWMRRFDTDYRTLHTALRCDNAGEPLLISQRHRNPLSVIKFDQRELITSSASHDIDIFRWLTGEEVTEVSAATKTSRDGSAVLVILTLTSRSGILGVMELVRGQGLPYDIGCDIVTDAGALALTPSAPDPADLLYPGAQAWMQRFAQAYRAQDAAWLAAVGGTEFPGASAYDGYATNAVIDAALASLVSGHAESVQLQAII